ncbi:hypothetical protein CY34DRAFT_157922 [Suillus luteus UH-Slu-Lm8-n1]|uniref:Uncharacterized protein n=1 Tax=Suillus luteus UH-Slu-Lm8-n1 TaxID=930992 RepID=A0A0D0B6T4_9AGAM|nr:hypothetical protein CY34DRAFT_157922 [Suillus luteus UH-Slu-Lm8-n1]
MPQQPTQTGQWPTPGLPQHYYHYPQMPQPPSVPSHVEPYPMDLQTHSHNQFTPVAHPYPVPPPQHWGGYPQGVGVPSAQAQRFYPSAPPSVQPLYNQYPTQGLVQPPPVAAAEESAVKRGKRKAADLDDVRPLKKPAVQPLVNNSGFGYIELTQHQNYMAQFPFPDSDKVISRGDSSNIDGSPSKTQEEAVAEVPCEGSPSSMLLEFFPDIFEGYNWTSSEPLEEPVNSFDHSEFVLENECKWKPGLNLMKPGPA